MKKGLGSSSSSVSRVTALDTSGQVLYVLW